MNPKAIRADANLQWNAPKSTTAAVHAGSSTQQTQTYIVQTFSSDLYRLAGFVWLLWWLVQFVFSGGWRSWCRFGGVWLIAGSVFSAFLVIVL